MFRRLKTSLLFQVILAIIFSSLLVTSMISFILFNMSTNYIESIYTYSTDSDRINNVMDILSFDQFRLLFFFTPNYVNSHRLCCESLHSD